MTQKGGFDLDIQLYDAANTVLPQNNPPPALGYPIVSYCGPDWQGKPSSCGVDSAKPTTFEYDRGGDFQIKGLAPIKGQYSGYNGIDNAGDESLDIEQTSAPLNFAVYSYTDEPNAIADVSYSWDGKDTDCCQCTGKKTCDGVPFEREMVYNEYSIVGTIPAGVKNVRILLATFRKEQDIDIALYNPATRVTIVGYCIPGAPTLEGQYCPGSETDPGGEVDSAKGIIACRKPGNAPDAGGSCEHTMDGVTFTYSGYDGINGFKGEESITIAGVLPYDLEMRAFAFKSGKARVTYSWENGPDKCL